MAVVEPFRKQRLITELISFLLLLLLPLLLLKNTEQPSKSWVTLLRPEGHIHLASNLRYRCQVDALGPVLAAPVILLAGKIC